jgi:hypothetical protein
MKGIAVGLLLLAIAGTGTMMAADHNWRSRGSHDWRRADYGRHDHDRNWRSGDYVRHDQDRGCRDRRDVYSDIRRDERQLERDRWEARQYEREHNYRAAERERERVHDPYRNSWYDRQAAQRDRYDRAMDWIRFASSGWR